MVALLNPVSLSTSGRRKNRIGLLISYTPKNVDNFLRAGWFSHLPHVTYFLEGVLFHPFYNQSSATPSCRNGCPPLVLWYLLVDWCLEFSLSIEHMQPLKRLCA